MSRHCILKYKYFTSWISCPRTNMISSMTGVILTHQGRNISPQHDSGQSATHSWPIRWWNQNKWFKWPEYFCEMKALSHKIIWWNLSKWAECIRQRSVFINTHKIIFRLDYFNLEIFLIRNYFEFNFNIILYIISIFLGQVMTYFFLFDSLFGEHQLFFSM